jgi:3-isopropylmalate/(R)-2-methylmalate dehydratase small subunit
MIPFTIISGSSVLLPLDNIDTDQLIPARFMKRSRSEGYGDYLLHDLRQTDGNPAQRLDTDAGKASQILISGRNFGSGSSREAAVYALVDYGIRCVIAPSFGDIFASNAIKNGLLPAVLSAQDLERLNTKLAVDQASILSIDLPDQLIRIGNEAIAFDIDPVWKTQLINGWDDIDMTRSYQNEIDQFAEKDKQRRPWIIPVRAQSMS